jgi:hypothetical protein
MSCSKTNECGNRFDFIHTNDTISIFDLDYEESSDSTYKRMSDLLFVDICDKCGWVEFKSPFIIEGKNGYLKLFSHFDYLNCSNCPIGRIIERNNFEILVNSKNQILSEQEFVTIETLKTSIKNYLSKVGDSNYPNTYEDVFYSIKWDRKVEKTFIDEVFTCIYSAHTDFVEIKALENGIDFCTLDNVELLKLKAKYPIRIIINLAIMSEPPFPFQPLGIDNK